MLLFTKEELKSRISCLKQMMNALNIKMNYFENLLQGLECSSTEKHCLIINVSFADVPMDAFMECDTIEVVTNSNNFKDRDKHFNFESKMKTKNIPKHKRNKTPRIVNIEPNPQSTNVVTVKQEDVIRPTTISNNFNESPENNYEMLRNNESINEVPLPLSTGNYEVSRKSPQEDIKQHPVKHQNQFISQISEDQALISMENSCSILSSLMFNESLDNLNSTSKSTQNTVIQSSNAIQRSNINSYPFSQSNDVFPPTSSRDLMSNIHMNSIPNSESQILKEESQETIHFLQKIPRKYDGKIARKRCHECYRKIKIQFGTQQAIKKAKQVDTECKGCILPFCLLCFENYHKYKNK